MRMTRYSILIFCVSFFLSSANSQEATSRAKLPAESRPLTVGLFMNGLPLPLLSDGLGGAIEVTSLIRLSLWLGHEREGTDDGLFDVFGPRQTVVSTNEFIGVRYYILPNRLTPYVAGGFKWSTTTINYIPAIFNGVPVSQKLSDRGPYAGLGLRWQAGPDRHFHWMIDAGVGLEPGHVKRSTYVVDEKSPLGGASKAHLDTDIGYGIEPEARFGVSF